MQKRYALLFCTALVLNATASIAQSGENLTGTYTGSYQTQNDNGSSVSVGVELTITKVEGGVVAATLKRNARDSCRGEYIMTGKFNGETLGLRSAQKGGTTGDCTFSMSAKVEGNKLIGTAFGKRPLELSK